MNETLKKASHFLGGVLPLVLIAAVFAANVSIAATATFGVTTDSGSQQAFSGDRMYLSTASPSSSGTVVSATCRSSISVAGSYPAKIVVYADNGGTPDGGALLAETDQMTISNTTEQENTAVFSGANLIAVTSGTPYWFGLFFDDPGVPNAQISRLNNVGVVHFLSTVYPTAPSPFTSGGTANGPHDCYITYEEDAPAGGAKGTLTLPQGELRIMSGTVTL